MTDNDNVDQLNELGTVLKYETNQEGVLKGGSTVNEMGRQMTAESDESTTPEVQEKPEAEDSGSFWDKVIDVSVCVGLTALTVVAAIYVPSLTAIPGAAAASAIADTIQNFGKGNIFERKGSMLKVGIAALAGAAASFGGPIGVAVGIAAIAASELFIDDITGKVTKDVGIPDIKAMLKKWRNWLAMLLPMLAVATISKKDNRDRLATFGNDVSGRIKRWRHRSRAKN